MKNVLPFRGVDGHDVVAEELAETGGHRLGIDLIVQVHVLGRVLLVILRVDHVHQRLDVDRELHGRLGLGAYVGQEQPIAADQRREEADWGIPPGDRP